MRAELIFEALRVEPNRYALVRTAAKATRMLHRPNTRIEDSMNEALRRLALPSKELKLVTMESPMVPQRNAA